MNSTLASLLTVQMLAMASYSDARTANCHSMRVLCVNGHVRKNLLSLCSSFSRRLSLSELLVWPVELR